MIVDLKNQIREANSQAQVTDVKGAPYIAVHERVKAFRKVFPAGRIETDVRVENGVCTCTAQIFVQAGDLYLFDQIADPTMPVLLATGTAVEKDGSSYINKTSFVENCETSAVGRALGFAGFGIVASIASADEVVNAVEQQTAAEKIDKNEAEVLRNLIKSEAHEKNLLERFGVASFEELTREQYAQAVTQYKQWLTKRAKK